MKKNILLIFLFIYQISFSQQLPPLVLSALEDFSPSTDRGYIPYYKDVKRNALAINAATYKNQFSLAEYTYEGTADVYLASIQTIAEDDGESTYKLYKNGKLLATVQNPTTDKKFETKELVYGKIKLKPGDNISIAFDSHTNGKIPEGDITAYSRGRWVALILSYK
ncbi:hypothetical protein N7E81_17145 [Reichenbachiella carrageenanivorans]|uniref:Uncharacterized protein n=1 Tax=Reichenbachiella carrageenanivorans TaxID=2979869 RepID=A0ABY6D1W4_9BACT|nr:hypothetical protein [Reichenbachiella carrageenanivorans]UXX79083.1 hypothetical protein N7E81_17145 [Reichenbachiella carrageenanivorans]